MRVIIATGTGIIVVVLAAWTILASRIFVLIGGLSAAFPSPWTTWWRYARHPVIDGTTMIYLAVSGIIAALPILAFLIAFMSFWRSRKRLRRPFGGGLKPIEVGVSDNHGHAAWPSVEDMLRRYGAPAPDHGAVVMGEARRVDQEPVASIPYDRNDKQTWGQGGKAGLLFHDPKSGLSASPHSFWCIGTGGGKAQPLDAKVLTPTGFRNMGDLKVGDLVQSPDGKSIPILGVYPQGEKEIYRVTFTDGRSTECCGDHLWKVWSRICIRNPKKNDGSWERSWDWRVKTLSQIRTSIENGSSDGKRVAIPLVEPCGIEHPPQALPIPAYTMGAMLGDGHFNIGNVQISTADPEILERIRSDLPEYEIVHIAKYDFRLKMKSCSDHKTQRQRERALTPYVRKPYTGRHSYTVSYGGRALTVSQWEKETGVPRNSIYNRLGSMGWTVGEALGFESREKSDCTRSPLKLALNEFGLSNARSHTKFVPEIYKRGSSAQRLALLQGLLDTDGTVSGAASTHATFTTTSERLALDVQEIAWSLGAIANIYQRKPGRYEYKGECRTGKPVWNVSIVHPDTTCMFSLPRKLTRCKKKSMRHRLGIASIEPVGRKEAQCIKVGSEDMLYVTDNYIVTHNTMQAAEVQYHWLGSIITFDPSCELGPMMKRWREKIGQRVVFIGKDSSQGQQGIAALDCIRPGTPDAESRILSMVASICGEETERKDKNSVFDSAGRNLIACLLAHLMYDKSTPDHLRTMKSLVDGITIPEDQMQATLRNIHSTSDSLQARRLAGIVMGTHKETFSGAYFSATQYAGWLLDPENAALLSGTLKPSEILQGNLSIYIQIPTGSLLYVPGPGRVILDSIVSSVLQANGKYTDLMLVQADEAKLIGAMKSIEVVLTQGRKYGIVLNMIYTSINDMRRVWTEDGLETWLDNVEWAGFAAVGSKTAKWLSEELGKMAVLAYSEGSNSGTSSQSLGSGSRSKGSNVSGHEIGRSLMNPDEFKDMRRDEAIIWFRTGRPIRCGLAPYYRRTPENIEIDTTSFRREEMLAAE